MFEIRKPKRKETEMAETTMQQVPDSSAKSISDRVMLIPSKNFEFEVESPKDSSIDSKTTVLHACRKYVGGRVGPMTESDVRLWISDFIDGTRIMYNKAPVKGEVARRAAAASAKDDFGANVTPIDGTSKKFLPKYISVQEYSCSNRKCRATVRFQLRRWTTRTQYDRFMSLGLTTRITVKWIHVNEMDCKAGVTEERIQGRKTMRLKAPVKRMPAPPISRSATAIKKQAPSRSVHLEVKKVKNQSDLRESGRRKSPPRLSRRKLSASCLLPLKRILGLTTGNGGEPTGVGAIKQAAAIAEEPQDPMDKEKAEFIEKLAQVIQETSHATEILELAGQFIDIFDRYDRRNADEENPLALAIAVATVWLASEKVGDPIDDTRLFQATRDYGFTLKDLHDSYNKVAHYLTEANGGDLEEESMEIDRDAENVDEETMKNLLASFDLAKMPQELPCREAELKEIRSFVESNLNAETSGCICVCGVPGTGKTAAIRFVVQQLEREQHHLPKFVFGEVNGLCVTDPKRVLVEFHKALWNTQKFFPESDTKPAPRISPPTARRILNRKFELDDNNRPSVVLLLDEIDALVTKRQEQLYQILDWSNQDGAKLIVLAVANALDFPERALSNRNSSRMGLRRLCFKPYDHKQIENILINRLENSQAVEPMAVEYVARKVASVSGDVRRAFEICRIAIQFVLTDANEHGESMTLAKRERKNQAVALCGPLTQEHADRALKKLAMNVKVQAIRKASTHEKLLLESAMAENRRIGLDEIAFNQIWQHYQLICKEREKEPLCVDELLDVANRLVDWRLLLGVHSSSREDFTAKYRLNVNVGDLHFALYEH